MKIFNVVILAALMTAGIVQAQLPNKWDIAEIKLLATNQIFYPNTWISIGPIRINHTVNSPQFFTLYGIIGDCAEQAVQQPPKLAVYVTSGIDSVHLFPEFSRETGDTLWAISKTKPYEVIGDFGVIVDPPGGDWMGIWILNQPGGDSVMIDSLWLWMKH